MSKRGSDGFGGDEERYGQIRTDSTKNGEEPPQKATAAQLARRKIAQMKKPGRARSGSPAVVPQGDGGFGGVGGNTFAQSQPAQNPFQAGNFNFSFGQPQQAQQENGGTFQFGMSAPAPSQQNGTTDMFGQTQPAAPSFGSFQNAGSAQASTNGFNPSTSSIFTQSAQNNSTPSFGGFGATQQNSTTPATTTSSTFGSFSQTQNGIANGASGTPFTGFGAPQQESEKPKSAFSGFGVRPQEEKSANPFASFGTTQTDKPKEGTPFSGFGATQQDKDTSRASTPFSGFGATQPEKPSNPFSSFGQTQPVSNDKPSTLFGQSQANGDKTSDIFAGHAQKLAETNEQASTPFAGFGQSKMQAAEKQSTLFAGLGQTNGDKPQENENTTAPSNIFGGFGGKQTNGASTSTEANNKPLFAFAQTQATPKADQPSNGVFSQTAQANGEKKGLFGASLAAASTPAGPGSIFDNLPKKDLSKLFSSVAPSQPSQEEPDEEDNVNVEQSSGSTNIFGQSQQKPSLFAPSQSTQATPKPTSNLFKMSTQDSSLATPSNSTTNIFGSTNEKAASSTSQTPGRSLFDRIDKDDAAKRLGKEDESNKSAETPRATLFNTTSETPMTAKPSFAPKTSTSSLFSKPAAAIEAPKDAPGKSLFQKPSSQPPTSQPSTRMPLTPAPPSAPPVSFRAPPATAPASRMAAPFARPAIISNLTSDQTIKLRQLNQGLVNHLNGEDPEKDWTAIFQYYMKMASQISGSTLPAEATASVTQTAVASEVPATGNLFARAAASNAPESSTPAPKPATSSLFSKPPSTAPPANKKRAFENDEESASRPPATEKRPKPNESVSYPKLPENASSTSRLFEAALDKSKSSSSSSTFSPATKPLFSAPTSQTPAAKSSTGGFMPTASASAVGSTNFLASFGKVAKDNEEKERKKRKANDYDSDNETEEAWEKRDREEQEAKRAKLAEAAKTAKGFSFTGSSEAPTTPAFKLGSSNTTSTTPAVPPPKFNGIFGSMSKQPASSTPADASKLAPPTGFGFGPTSSSKEASRATTPGATTDGEASTAAEDAGEPSDEPNQAQIEDQTALQPAEREANDVLMEVDNALTRKFSKKEGEEKSSFQTQGEGRLYVLKDKSTGKVRILSRVGMGKLVLNFNPLKNCNYTVHSKKENLVICDFLDHINHSPSKPDRFYITVTDGPEAKKLAKVLTEGIPK